MKKLLLVLAVLFVSIISISYAANVGIIVEFQDGSIKTDCVNVEDETNGYDLLQESVFNILWSPESAFGSLICRIDGEGTDVQGNFCEYFGEFWNFNILFNEEKEWMHSPVGHNGPGGCWNRKENSFSGHYCAVDEDVLGYKFGEGAEEPPLMSYKEVCEKLNVKNLKVYVNGKKDGSADESGGKIEAIPGSEIEIKIELENLYKEDIKIEDISIDGIIEDVFGNDLKDEERFGLNFGSSKEATLAFNVPKEAEEGDYDLTIEINGENERGFKYSKKIEFDVDVEKKENYVIFDKFEFSPSDARCGSSINLQVGIINLGLAKEKPILKIFNEELGISIEDKFDLDIEFPGNKAGKNYKILIPRGIKSGIYEVAADLIYSGKIEQSAAKLKVICGANHTTLEAKSEEHGKADANSITGSLARLDRNSGNNRNIEPETSNKKIALISLASLGMLAIISISLSLAYLVVR